MRVHFGKGPDRGRGWCIGSACILGTLRGKSRRFTSAGSPQQRGRPVLTSASCTTENGSHTGQLQIQPRWTLPLRNDHTTRATLITAHSARRCHSHTSIILSMYNAVMYNAYALPSHTYIHRHPPNCTYVNPHRARGSEGAHPCHAKYLGVRDH